MDWVREHVRAIVVAVIILAAAAAVYGFIVRSRSIRAANAESALNTARQSYAAGNLPLAQTDLKRLAERYDGTSAGTQAAMLLAQVYYDQAKPDSGLAVLNAADPSDADRAAVEALKGAGLEQKGEFAQAAARYQAAVTMTDRKLAKDGYKADAARAFTAAGNKAEALRIWTELAADERSFYAAEARVRIGELNAKTATQS